MEQTVEKLVEIIEDSSSHDVFLNDLETFYNKKDRKQIESFNKRFAKALLKVSDEKRFEMMKQVIISEDINEEVGQSEELYSAFYTLLEK